MKWFTIVAELYDSYIEWTCAVTGMYYINVHEYGRDTGTFSLSVTATDASFATDAGGGDPCVGGARMTEDNAVISFQPDGEQRAFGRSHI